MAENTRLTPKQKAFCEYYLQSFNATDAAIKAGYSEKSAHDIGCENLKKPNIKDYIEKVNKVATNKRILTLEQLKEFYTNVVTSEEVEMKDRISAADKLGKYIGISEAEKRRFEIEKEKLEIEKAKNAAILNADNTQENQVADALRGIIDAINQ